MSLTRFFAALVASLAVLGGASAAHASFHLIKIVQIFPGTNLQGNAQYVLLQAYAAGQANVSGHTVHFYDASGTETGSAAFTGSVANSANQMVLLVATAEAETLFGITADLKTTQHFDPKGGKICWDALDCVSWGNYAGAEVPFSPLLGLRLGQAASRRLDLGDPAKLESTDDTGNNANDFRATAPGPRNNGGSFGTLPALHCGDGTVDGLEECDDHNGDDLDGCDRSCIAEVCGDLKVNDLDNETCDDGNFEAGDGCDAVCHEEGVVADVPTEAGPDAEADPETSPETSPDVPPDGDTATAETDPTDVVPTTTDATDATTGDAIDDPTTTDATTATTTADPGADGAANEDVTATNSTTADQADASPTKKDDSGCAGGAAEGLGLALAAALVLGRRKR